MTTTEDVKQVYTHVLPRASPPHTPHPRGVWPQGLQVCKVFRIFGFAHSAPKLRVLSPAPTRGRAVLSPHVLWGNETWPLKKSKEETNVAGLHFFLFSLGRSGATLPRGLFGSFRVVADRQMTSLSGLSFHKPRPCRRPQRSKTKREPGSALPHAPA